MNKNLDSSSEVEIIPVHLMKHDFVGQKLLQKKKKNTDVYHLAN